MPGFERTAVCRAPPEEVWKLLHDPARFPEWWDGVERVESRSDWVDRYMAESPDFAYPTRIRGSREAGRVTVSCMISEIRQDWTLARAPEGCLVRVRVELPEAEAQRLEQVRDVLASSLPRLVRAAEVAAGARATTTDK